MKIDEISLHVIYIRDKDNLLSINVNNYKSADFPLIGYYMDKDNYFYTISRNSKYGKQVKKLLEKAGIFPPSLIYLNNLEGFEWAGLDIDISDTAVVGLRHMNIIVHKCMPNNKEGGRFIGTIASSIGSALPAGLSLGDVVSFTPTE